MKINEEGRIISATRAEIYHKWLEGGWENITPFETFLCALEDNGTKIVEEIAEDEDFIQVVRCKDCRWRNITWINERGFEICSASNMEITDMDYCSYGERREGKE